jgi:hypothetical protein
MRVPAQCPRCRQIDERRQSMYEVTSGKRSREPDALSLQEMDAADVHSGKLTLRCEQGHTTEVKLPIPAFELLFDFGCSALLDGYQREAVTSFAASFERFQEFACRFVLARRKLSFEGVDAWWKEVAAQSERQKGSFVALWIAEFFREPPTLPRKLDELRNDCVHKGRIPLESEAKAYGEAVLRAEVGGIVTFRNCFNSELEYDDFVEHHIIRPDENEPLLMSFLGNTVISGIWRTNELRPDEDEDEPESGEGLQIRDQKQKNRTDPTRLTMDKALRTFAGLRSLGLRRT